MTNEDEQYYENFFDLFQLAGWKRFIKDAEDAKEGFLIEQIESDKSLYHTQGQLAVLNNIINFEDRIKGQFEHIKAEELEEGDIDE